MRYHLSISSTLCHAGLPNSHNDLQNVVDVNNMNSDLQKWNYANIVFYLRWFFARCPCVKWYCACNFQRQSNQHICQLRIPQNLRFLRAYNPPDQTSCNPSCFQCLLCSCNPPMPSIPPMSPLLSNTYRLPQSSIPFLRLDVLTLLLIHRIPVCPSWAFTLPSSDSLAISQQINPLDLRLLQNNHLHNHPNMFAHLPI